MGIFSNLCFFFIPRGSLTKALMAVLTKNITEHGGKILGPEEATIAIVGKGSSLEGVDKAEKKRFHLPIFLSQLFKIVHTSHFRSQYCH